MEIHSEVSTLLSHVATTTSPKVKLTSVGMVINTSGSTTMHMGHLSDGSKMSKSLKNFQSMQDALRVVFLMGRWNDGVEISPDMRDGGDLGDNCQYMSCSEVCKC